jgi:hypothetical protein
MLAAIDPNAEMGPAGFFIFAGFLALIACGTLVSGLHPRWRATATWRGFISRSVFGSCAFSVGALIMGIGMVVRGILNQHGPLTGVVGLLYCSGATLLVLGPVYDLMRRMRRR